VLTGGDEGVFWNIAGVSNLRVLLVGVIGVEVIIVRDMSKTGS
jgi:hypothetical protein